MANKPTQPVFPLGLGAEEQSTLAGILNTGTIEHGPDAVLTLPEGNASAGLPSSVRYNADSDEFEGFYENGGWLPLGGGGIRWEALPHASTATLTEGRGYLVDNSTNVSTVVFPSPTRVGDSVTVCDLYGKFSLYPLTIDPNGRPMYGSTEPMTLSTDSVSATFTWSGDARGWIVTAGVGLGQGRVYSRTIFTETVTADTAQVTLTSQPSIVDVYVDGKRLLESKYSLDGFNVNFSPSIPSGSELQVIQYVPIQLGNGSGGSGGGTVITWIYNSGSAAGGETEIELDVDAEDVSEIFIGGSRQQKGLGFTYDSDTKIISLADELDAGDEVVVVINGDPTLYNQIDRTPNEVARSANVPVSQVILTSDTITKLDGKTVIYDVNAQKMWSLPSGIPTGASIVSVSGSNLTYAPGNVVVSLKPVVGSGTDTDLKYLPLRRNLFKGVADYVGTPLYDGNDQTRITFTDNTTALKEFLLSSENVVNGVKYVYIPTGHYGFGGPKIILDPTTLPYKSILIYGDGIGKTILDYVKEDNTGTGNTEQGDNALELIRFEVGFDLVSFVDVTTKCTTKHGFVNGIPSSDPSNWAIYNGTVWFCHIKQAKRVELDGVEATRGNYRCISIDGISDSSPAVTDLFMRNCIGHHNTSSGFWLRGIAHADIADCTFYRNGTLGVTATGYGLTFSQYCSNIKLKNVNSYENYRKGIDKHGGLGTVSMENVTVADNIVFQMSFDHQYNGKYDPSTITNMILSGVHISFGENLDFCNEALAAIDLQYRNHITVLLNDKNIDGTPANRLGSVVMNDCSIRYLPGVTQNFYGYNGLNCMASELRLDNLNMDIRNMKLDRAGNKTVYTFMPITMARDNNTLVINGGDYLTGSGKMNDNTGVASNALFISQVATGRVISDNACYDMQDMVLFGTTGGGRAFAWNGARKLNGNTFKFRDIQGNTHNIVGSGFAWLSTAMMFGGGAATQYGGKNRVGFGDCNVVADYAFGDLDNGVTFKVSNQVLSAASPLKILTGNLYGNLSMVLSGRCVRTGDTLAVRWLGSANTYQVATGSAILASGAPTDYTIQYNGVNTGFVCKAIPLTTTTDLAVTEFYLGEITGYDSYTPKFLGFAK
uniref:Uncharacterized protein n=1 Tax=Enterobacter phage EspM4VN TaxID=2137745 RepID=A0A4P2WVS0_9CAUD